MFEGFPLFFDTFIDYRGRLYPGSFLFSRTTGFYKYLVTDYKKVKLTSCGLYHLLLSYFKNDLKICNIINDVYKKEQVNEKKCLIALYDIYEAKNIDYQKPKKNRLYFEYLDFELSILPKQKYLTNVTVEIDQTGSHAVFCALLLGNKTLALESNLLGGEKRDVNSYLQSKIRPFIEERIFEENKNITVKNEGDGKDESIEWGQIPESVIDVFEKNRDCHKMTFMTFNYSQGPSNRAQKLIEIVEEHFINITQLERRAIYKIAFTYIDFLNFCFPKFKEQMKAFQKCYTKFAEMSSSTSIVSLDGTLFNWSFYLQKEHTGSRYNPITCKNEDYKRIIPYTITAGNQTVMELEVKKKKFETMLDNLPIDMVKQKEKLQQSLKKIDQRLYTIKNSVKLLQARKKRVFRPGFVHCLDASIIRILILKMFQNYKCEINHVHDSIQVHPNFVSLLFNEIKHVYTDLNKKDLFDLFYKPSAALLSMKNQKKFDITVKKFKQKREAFTISIVPENMYPYE